jgi:hypothetical protein
MASHFLRSHGCAGLSSWLPHHTGWTNAADEWAWSSFAVIRVPGSPDGEEAEAFSTPRMITGVGFVTPHVSNPHDYVNHMFKSPKC